MRFLGLFRIAPFLAAAFIAAAPGILFADCANPSGLKGEIVYNDDYDTMQFCDGQNWVSMSASGTAVESDPQVDTLTASRWCKSNAGGTAIECDSVTVPASASGSTGLVQFYASGTLGSDSAFFWDATNHRLGIGTAAPGTAVDVSGTVTATLFSGSGASLTALNASNLGSGTIPDARFPATLPALSGVNLTALNASNLGSGTIPDARFPATLPAASGVNLTNLNASNLASGTVPVARLGSSGTASATTFLRGDDSWSALTAAGSAGHVQFNNAGAFGGVAALFWDNSNSRLGIGTAGPAYSLEVIGKAKSSTVLLVPASTGAPQGTGSATYWNQGGTDLYYMTGNVGIGTATPSMALDVVGALRSSGNATVGGTLSSTGNFAVATDKLFVNASTGAVGIGTTSPAQKFHVEGTVQLGNASTADNYLYLFPEDSGNFAIEAHNAANSSKKNLVFNAWGGNVGIGTASPAERLSVVGSATDTKIEVNANGDSYSALRLKNSQAAYVWQITPSSDAPAGRIRLWRESGAPGELLSMTAGGNFGIGTASPATKLDVYGNAIFGTGAGEWLMLRAGGDLILTDSDGTGSLNEFIDSGTAHLRVDDGGNTGNLNINNGKLYLQGSSGNVGIGSANPQSKLDVAGKIIAAEGSGTNGGYSFENDGAYDTGMFSPSDGVLQFYNNGNLSIYANSSGNVGIGTASPGYPLDVNGGMQAHIIYDDDTAYYVDSNTWSRMAFINLTQLTMSQTFDDCPGGWTCNIRAWDVSVASLYYSGMAQRSDMRLKTAIEPLEGSPVIDRLWQLRPVKYEWKDRKVAKGPQYGLIAQEVEKVWPELVLTATDKMGTKSLSYINLIAPMLEGMKELKALNDNQAAQIRHLEDEVARLKAAIQRKE